jgi:hypothetical protein
LNIELRQEIIGELKKVRAPAKAARNLGVDLKLVLQVSDEIGGLSYFNREERWDGEGRPELRQYAVAKKRAYQVWDNNDPAIAAARAAYEAGTHDMRTGRDGNWLIMYLVPQRKVTPRPGYFTPEV